MGLMEVQYLEGAGFRILIKFLLHQSNLNRIHGGEDATEGEFPYIISIRRIANAFKHMCAGVLIHPDWVLTTAFCVGEVGAYSVGTSTIFPLCHTFPPQIDAVGGEHSLIVPSANEQIRGVDFIVRHPNYTHGDASVGGMAVSDPHTCHDMIQHI